jgi:hypothetical protein
MLVRDLFDDERVSDARQKLKDRAAQDFDDAVARARKMWRERP